VGFGPNPSITGSAAQRMLLSIDAEAAGRAAVAAEQAALDEQDLRDMERARYYDGPTGQPGGSAEPGPSTMSRDPSRDSPSRPPRHRARRRWAWIAIVAAGLVVLAPLAVIFVPQLIGPLPPAGANRLHIATEAPNLNLGCAAAGLAPVRVATSGDELTLVSVGSGETVRVVWPSGFGAWRIDGRAVVADQWGRVVGREGDVLDSLGGGGGLDGAFHICPFGIAPRG
jgi:hypothetical protein